MWTTFGGSSARDEYSIFHAFQIGLFSISRLSTPVPALTLALIFIIVIVRYSYGRIFIYVDAALTYYPRGGVG